MRPRLALLSGLLLLAACSARHFTLQPGPAGAGDLLIPPGQPPTSSRLHHTRLYGEYERDARLVLTRGMRIKVTAPILPRGERLKVSASIPDSPGPIAATSNVTGFEIAYYDALPWRFQSGEAVIAGQRQPLTAPRAAAVAVPLQTQRIELLFQRRLSPDDRSIALLADTQPITVGSGVALSPEIAIGVNGLTTWVPLGARVASIVKDPRSVTSLHFRRLDAKGRRLPVRFDRTNPRLILGVTLNAGDEFRWTK